MKKTRNIWLGLRRHSLIVAVTVAGFALYLYRLTKLPTGRLSPVEAAAAQASSNIHGILTAPQFLPLNVMRFVGLRLLPGHELWALRLPSVFLALLSIAALLYITRRWYGQRTLYFSIALLLGSAWLLHVGRLGTNDIAYAATLPLLLGSSLLLHEYTEKKRIFYLWAIVLALLLYIPGIVWLVLATVIWQRNEISEAVSKFSWLQRFATVLLCTLIVAPLVYGMVQQGSLVYLLQWLGLPGTLPMWQTPLKNLVAALLFVFVRSPVDPSLWLGRLPVLDAFMAISFLAGIVFYAGHIRADRTKLILLYGGISLLLCAFGEGSERSLFVPLLYLVAFGGIAYILHQWLKVFPRNPLARRLGIGLVCVAVALSTVYNARQFFVAWPHNSETKQTFSVEP